jgi:WD40 repeat protein
MLRTLPTAERAVDAIGFLSSGTQAFSGGADGTLRFYEMPNGKPIRIIKAYRQRCGLVAISPDEKLALTLGQDERTKASLKLWNLTNGQLVNVLPNLTVSINFMAISPNSRFALTGGYDIQQNNRVYVRDLKTLKPFHRFPAPERWSGPLGFSSDGTLALLSKSGMYGRKNQFGRPKPSRRLVLWDVRAKRICRTMESDIPPSLQAHGNSVAVFSKGGKHVISEGFNSTVLVWQAQTGRLIKSVTVYSADRTNARTHLNATPMRAFALSADGTTAAVVSGINETGQKGRKELSLTVKVWNLNKGHLRLSWHCPLGV